MSDCLPDILGALDHNHTAPLCLAYLTIAGNEPERQQEIWKSISLAVDSVSVPKKFDVSNALLVTFRNPNSQLSAPGTAWSHIVMEAAEIATGREIGDSSAEKLLSGVLLFAGEQQSIVRKSAAHGNS